MKIHIRIHRFWGLKCEPLGGVVFSLSQVCVCVHARARVCVCICVRACSHIQVLSSHSCVCQEFVLGMNNEFCQRLSVSLDMILWYFDPINMVNCINIFLNIESFSFVICGPIFHFPFQFCSFYLVEILLYLLFKNDLEVFLDFLCFKQLM